MAEWLQKNLKFPRLTFLGIGFLLGLSIALVSGWQFTTRIEEVEKIRETQLKEKQTTIQSLESRYSRLETEHKKMKSHVHISEKTNADGSTERTYDSKKSVESEKKVVEHQLTIQQLHYERKMELMEWEFEKKRIEESRASVSANIGYDSTLSKYIYLDYNFWGPLQMGLYGTDRGVYGLSLGITF